MANIWFTSDLHLCHDKEFVWKARGFNSVEEMNEAIVERFNSLIHPEDTLYILGDVMLNDNEKAEQYLARINGKKIFIRGNHDTNPRVEIYKKYTNEEIKWADVIKIKKRNIYLSHYPTLCSNYDMGKSLKTRVINLCGHTHTTNKFIDMKLGLIYHCELDAHNCKPVLIDDIITDIRLYLKENII